MLDIYSMYGYWVEIILILTGTAILAFGVSLFCLIRYAVLKKQHRESKILRAGIAVLVMGIILCVPIGYYLKIHDIDRLWHWFRYERPVVCTMPERAYEETETESIWYKHHIWVPVSQNIASQKLSLSDRKAYIENDTKGLTEIPLYEAVEEDGETLLCVGDDRRQLYCRKK